MNAMLLTNGVILQFSKVHFNYFSGQIYQLNSIKDNYLSHLPTKLHTWPSDDVNSGILVSSNTLHIVSLIVCWLVVLGLTAL